MLCPRCGSRQPVGSTRCAGCGTPFTRREASRRPTGRRGSKGGTAAVSYRNYQQGSRVRRSVIAWLAVLSIVIVAVVALAAFFSSTVVPSYVGRSVNNSLQGQIISSVPKVTPNPTASSGATQMVITQQEINDEIAKNAASYGPLSSVSVQIDNGQFIVNFAAYGMTGRYQGHVEMQNGEPIVTGGHITGMLGWFVPTSQVEAAFNRQIAAAVQQAGVQVSSVALRPGEMVLTLTS